MRTITFSVATLSFLFLASVSTYAAVPEALPLEERVEAQRAIEEVYWRHRIWPEQNPSPKPALAEMLPDRVLVARVDDTLARSAALVELWQRPVTPHHLQAELERMARSTRNPEMLEELFAALDHDPLLIAESLARPVLVDRLIRKWYAYDPRFHGQLRAEIERSLARSESAAQMELLDGEYTEVEILVPFGRDRDALTSEEMDDPGILELDADSWRAFVARLADAFGTEAPTASAPLEALDESLPTGRISGLVEAADHFAVHGVLERTTRGVRLASVRWPKRAFDDWWSETRAGLEVEGVFSRTTTGADAGQESYTEPLIAAGGCMPGDNDIWYPVYGKAPDSRSLHTAVWTGSEMIVWGGWDGDAYLDSGGRYVPATDSWTPTAMTNAPAPRRSHTAVWTGLEMIVWGGWDSADPLGTGGRYDPSTDTWTSTSTAAGAPGPRQGHTAVWTGSEMIVWGGFDAAGDLNTGGRYDPFANNWNSTPTTGAPTGRRYHTAVWTGTQMIVWSGYDGANHVNTGAMFNPLIGSWNQMTNTGAPDGRRRHTAVWVGDAMVVWGGYDGGNHLNTGGRYFAPTNTWSATPTTGAPTGRRKHTAVWTGSEMIVWGGFNGSVRLNSGARYDPGFGANTWTATSETGAPGARWEHTAVWTGSEMIVWGGADGTNYRNGGGRYHPGSNSWVATARNNSTPEGRRGHTTVWTGTEMIVWGGFDGTDYLNTGGRYDPALDVWAPTVDLAYAPRSGHSAVWTGSEMYIWGGTGDGIAALAIGWRYDPSTDSGTAISVSPHPPASWDHTAVWTGTHMIVWGGFDGTTYLNSGGVYSDFLDEWTTETTTSGAPSMRRYHAAVWTGSEMIVWGGYDGTNLDDGARYSRVSDSWAPITSSGAPPARRRHTGVWTGEGMIVWGGAGNSGNLKTGFIYTPTPDPTEDYWTPVDTTGAPTRRVRHTAVWTGREMIVWGGVNSGDYTNTGGRYDPASDSWTPTSTGADVPRQRRIHTAQWTDAGMIVWGGDDDGAYLSSGGEYCVCHDWYEDADGDEFGNGGVTQCLAAQPGGWVSNGNDCNDGSPLIHPGASEIVDDGIDQDCSGADTITCFVDADQDSYGTDAGTTVLAADGSCDTAQSESSADTDCNDTDATIYPDAPETNDGLDNQCPGDAGWGLVDEISGDGGFTHPTDPTAFCWDTQAGATSYEVAQADDAAFTLNCSTTVVVETCLSVTDPPAGEISFILVRALAPNLGSWGAESSGAERTNICP